MAENPLLRDFELPPFDEIKPEHVEPAIDRILSENRRKLAELLASGGPWTWESLILPLEEMDDRLDKAWAPVRHLNAVVSTESWRKAYNRCLPKLSDYSTEIGQNEALYRAHLQLRESPEYSSYDAVQKKILEDALRDFRLAGVALPEEKKARFKEIERRLAQLSSKFEENVLDATFGWFKQITTESRLAGIPENARKMAEETAKRKGLEGWVWTLEFPSYLAVMTYAEDRELRREMYEAFVTRASDQGPCAGRWDNGPLCEEILRLRQEKASLLGFNNFAELSLATKMARSPKEVLDFLRELARRARPFAQRELEELKAFAKAGRLRGAQRSKAQGCPELEAWDLMFYSEKLRQEKFKFSQEELRPYFPAPKVVSGLFRLVERLFGLKISRLEGVPVWHPEVEVYEIRDSEGRLRGRFYLDLYARERKRGGAWMDECVAHRLKAGRVQLPVAFLTCNFTPPTEGQPALLTHDEVLTLFHEFGHGLHHMLTQVPYVSVSGIRGVEWDAVELPSQFMENFCYRKEVIELISGHYETGEPLPEKLFQRLVAAKNFQSGMQTVRQLEFALFDFRIHVEKVFEIREIYRVLEEVREEVAVFKPPKWNRFAHSFSHIFGGGYAAGYYSYKWAEVLAADAFARFEEEGLFDPEVGRAFLQHILEVGGSRPAMESFVAFRGREPEIEALLRQSGLLEE